MQTFTRRARGVIDCPGFGPCFALVHGTPDREISIGRQTVGMWAGAHSLAHNGADENGVFEDNHARAAMPSGGEHRYVGNFTGPGERAALIAGSCEVDAVVLGKREDHQSMTRRQLRLPVRRHTRTGL